jgi:hypothetical protein
LRQATLPQPLAVQHPSCHQAATYYVVFNFRLDNQTLTEKIQDDHTDLVLASVLGERMVSSVARMMACLSLDLLHCLGKYISKKSHTNFARNSYFIEKDSPNGSIAFAFGTQIFGFAFASTHDSISHYSMLLEVSA